VIVLGVEKCSTPFGITEGSTKAVAMMEAMKEQMCSTPFGITEGSTARLQMALIPAVANMLFKQS
jgi:hypothetical protein